MRDVVVLLSGGVDSITLAAYAADRLAACVFFNYGQPPAAQEEAAASAWTAAHEVPLARLAFAVPGASMATGVGAVGPRVVPARNIIMLSLAVPVALAHGAKEIWYGAIKDDLADYADCRPEFVTAASALLGYVAGIRVVAPFISRTKTDVLAIARTLDVDVAATWSCYEPRNGKPCGSCNSCRLRFPDTSREVAA